MPQPVYKQSGQTRSTLDYTPKTGPVMGPAKTTVATAQLPVIVPPVLIGMDYIQITPGSGQQTLPFKALIKRDTTKNPQQLSSSSNETITVAAGDAMFFTAYALGDGSQNVGITLYAVDSANTRRAAPYLGPGTYVNFVAVVDKPTAFNGTIIGQLHYQLGSL